VLTSTLARRIVIEEATARGVEIETLRGPRAGVRETVRAGVVVSNADLLLTLERLVGPEHLPPEAVEPVRRLRATFPCWLTHLGLKGVPAAVLEEAQGYYWDSWDMERVGRDALRFKLFAPTLYEPAMAPEGEQILIVQKVLDMDYDSVQDWPRHKREIETFIFSNLERVIPGIGERIAVRTSASARTSWRFTLNHRGAMLGWEMSPGQLGAGRPAPETAIRGLHCVGHWTQPGGGITPVIVSAMRVARAVTGRAESRVAPAGVARSLARSLEPNRPRAAE